MQYTIYSQNLKSKYNKITMHDLAEALKAIFPKFGIGITYEEFCDSYMGFSTRVLYPDDMYIFDIMLDVLVKRFNITDKQIYELFDNYFKKQDEHLYNAISEVLSMYMPYYASGSPILQQAQNELPYVTQEYSARLASKFEKDRVTLLYYLMRVQRKNVMRSDYYAAIKEYFKSEVDDLTSRLQIKYPQNTEYIALEILMQILIQGLNTQKPVK